MLDLLMTSYLLFVFPAVQIWRSVKPGRAKPERPRIPYYRACSMQVLLMLAGAGVACWSAGRSASELGIPLTLSPAGKWGLVVACAILMAFALADLWWEAHANDEKRAEYAALLRESNFLPRNGREVRSFLPMALVSGAGWEMLYRGYLLAVLAPEAGLAAAVALSALAYGLGHGWDGSAWRLLASILAAFLFTVSYAVTQSLWWLILLHAGLAVQAGLHAFRIRSAQPGAQLTAK